MEYILKNVSFEVHGTAHPAVGKQVRIKGKLNDKPLTLNVFEDTLMGANLDATKDNGCDIIVDYNEPHIRIKGKVTNQQ